MISSEDEVYTFGLLPPNPEDLVDEEFFNKFSAVLADDDSIPTSYSALDEGLNAFLH
jgi:hypothetical protein